MNPLLKSSLLSIAYQNLFEHSAFSVADDSLDLYSSRHLNKLSAADFGSTLLLLSAYSPRALAQAFPQFASNDGLLSIPHPQNDLTDHLALLAQIFQTAATLPRDPDLQDLSETEAWTRVKSRLGQENYRAHQLALWSNACAVTGLSEPSLLRASHAKPWSDPSISAAERLDPENGFPLAVHLDALFDQGWISFADDGHMLLSPHLDPSVISLYNLSPALSLRRPPSPRQIHYLSYHRHHIFRP
jgi:hypothetical protein